MKDTRERAESLKTLRKVASSLLEDTIQGHPTKNIHTHLYSLVMALETFIDGEIPVGGHESKTTTDAPSQVDPEKYPGGRHARDAMDILTEQVDAMFRPDLDDVSVVFSDTGPITEAEAEFFRNRDAQQDVEGLQRGLYDVPTPPSWGRKPTVSEVRDEVESMISSDEELARIDKECEEFLTRVEEFVQAFDYRDREGLSIHDTKSPYELEVGVDKKYGFRVYIQMRCWRMDVVTKNMGWGDGGKRYLSPHMTDRELFNQLVGVVKAYHEHEIHENVSYKGERVFSPHIDPNALASVASIGDRRGNG